MHNKICAFESCKCVGTVDGEDFSRRSELCAYCIILTLINTFGAFALLHIFWPHTCTEAIAFFQSYINIYLFNVFWYFDCYHPLYFPLSTLVLENEA